MKKCILTGVNAKFVHTNLAIRYLKQAAKTHQVVCYEVTINDHLQDVAARLLALNGDFYGFSCYIWNMEMITKLTEILKKSRPEITIFLGGPEVSYDGKAILATNPWVDYIISGEGEIVFPEFLSRLESGEIVNLPSVISRDYPTAELSVVEDLSALPFPYTKEEMPDLSGKILYYETMRGCPFKCAYCLSSTLKNVRFLPLERVFEELQFFINAQVRQVKFVDRTFNVDRKRTFQIIEWLVDHQNTVTQTNFHFEIAADLLDEALLTIIEKAPKGMIQFEIGVQSTDLKTLKAITRKTDLKKIWNNVKRLLAFGNCHVHLDLIAGLPYEDYQTFGHSFDDVIALKPQMLQLGFLKLLKGTRIRLEEETHDYAYTSFPPYEVISNRYISAQELHQLKKIESILDRYYNSGAFNLTLSAIFDAGHFKSPFIFFEQFAEMWRENGYFEQGIARDTLYAILGDFLKIERFPASYQELLKMDYLMQGKRSLPKFMENTGIRKEQAFELLKNEAFLQQCFGEVKKIPAKQRIKQVFFQKFSEESLKIAARYDQTFAQKGTLCVFEKGRAAVADCEV